MTVSREDFTAAMRQFPAAVNIITTGLGEGRHGFTATAVMSLTAEPAQIAVAVNRSVTAHPAIVANGRFCVSTLGSQHYALARRFAGAVKGLERFEEGGWITMTTGCPALEDAVANFDCEIAQRIELSTHTLFVGDVVALRHAKQSGPLLFVDGDWGSLLHASQKDFDGVMRGMGLSMAAVDRAVESVGDPLERLERFVRDFTNVTISERAIGHRSLGAELYVQGEPLDKLNEARREFDRKIRLLLEEGQKEGRFDLADPAVAAFAISGLVGWVHRWFRPDGRLSAEEVSRHLAELVQRMVLPPSSDDAGGRSTDRVQG